MSEISREALWAAVEKEDKSICKHCGKSARWHIRQNGASTYACSQHVVLFLGEISTVRAL